jgi:hypothetical protein
LVARSPIFIGILCWALRYFALGQSADAGGTATLLIFTAILLDGVGYDFLFIAGHRHDWIAEFFPRLAAKAAEESAH